MYVLYSTPEGFIAGPQHRVEVQKTHPGHDFEHQRFNHLMGQQRFYVRVFLPYDRKGFFDGFGRVF